MNTETNNEATSQDQIESISRSNIGSNCFTYVEVISTNTISNAQPSYAFDSKEAAELDQNKGTMIKVSEEDSALNPNGASGLDQIQVIMKKDIEEDTALNTKEAAGLEQIQGIIMRDSEEDTASAPNTNGAAGFEQNQETMSQNSSEVEMTDPDLSQEELDELLVYQNEIQEEDDASREQQYLDFYKEFCEKNLKLAKALKKWYRITYPVDPNIIPIDPSFTVVVAPIVKKSGKELLNEAYVALEEAKGSFSQLPFTDFIQITQLQCCFDEYGKHVDRTVLNDDGTQAEFYKDKSGQRKTNSFFDTIKEQVFRTLKYLGDFNDLVKSQYFISGAAENEFFYMASAKVPFYFVYFTCQQIQDQLMARYQEDPFKPISFVTYQQWDQDKGVIEDVVADGIRTINLAQLYQKMKTTQPTLICVGQRLIHKSSLLNSLFNVNFETLATGAPGIFHDSVDLMFASREFATGFNVIDFNGQANQDYQMIELLLSSLPRAVLLVQSDSTEYIDNVLKKMSLSVRKKYANQIVYIDKSKDKDGNSAAPSRLKVAFSNFRHIKKAEAAQLCTSQVFIMGQETQGNLFISKVNSLREKLTKFFDDLAGSHDTIEKDRMVPQAQMNYQGVWGGYWLLEDIFREMSQKESYFQRIKVIYKDQNFRDYHTGLKKYLADIESQGIQLSRKLVFPLYNKQLEKRKLKIQHEDQDAILSQEKKRNIEQALVNLEARVVEEHHLFKLFREYYLAKRHDLVNDLLSVVESDYLPRISGKKKELKICCQQASEIREQMQTLCPEQDKTKKKTLSQEQEQKFQDLQLQKNILEEKMKQLLDEIEDKVLDSDLFLREAKQFYQEMSGPRGDLQKKKERKEFLKILMNEFKDGKPLEIIDGDMDKCEKHSLHKIMKWISEVKGQSDKSIFVVTVLGPQSSGKSTLMNYLFGAKFAVSAGRCTKGLNAMLLTTNFPEVPDLIILDSEGIFSIERDDAKYDRRLAIFCMSISNLLLINIKGEVNVSVAKVLQIAVYAIKSITECKQASSVPNIQFILRDCVDGSNLEFVDSTCKTLRAKFTEAAEAASCTLESIINVEQDFSKMVCLFSSAFLQQPYAGQQMTLSAEVFRKKCAEFRYDLFKQQGDRVKKQTGKKMGFNGWAHSVDQVWTAVIQNENLMILSDLKSLVDYKLMVGMMEEYRNIMSKPCLKDSNGLLVPPHKNPLYVQDKDIIEYNEQQINADETFFAKCVNIIDEGIQNCKKSGTGDLSDKITAQVDSDLRALKQEEIKAGEERVKNATFKMEASIVSHALRYLLNSIDSISKKAEAEWQSQQAATSIEYAIKKTENTLKKWLLQQILINNTLSRNEFQIQVKVQTNSMLSTIKEKYCNKTEKDFLKEAEKQHELLFNQQNQNNKTDDQSKSNPSDDGNQLIRGINYKEKSIVLLRMDPEAVKNDQSYITEHYAKANPEIIQRNALILTRRQVQDQENEKIKTQKNQNIFQKTVNVVYDTMNTVVGMIQTKNSSNNNKANSKKQEPKINKNQEQASLNSHNQDFDHDNDASKKNEQVDSKTMYEQNVTFLNTDFKEKIADDCIKLLQELGEVRKNVEMENNKILVPRPYPQAEQQKLVSIFQKEIAIQTSALTNTDHRKFAIYQTNQLIYDFNHLLIYEFSKQNQFNERCYQLKIDKRINDVEENLSLFFDNQTQALNETISIAEEFIKKIDDFVMKLLNSHFADTFKSFFSEIDSKITKKEIQKLTQECFKGADQTRKQDIIDFMRDPKKLEERIFKEEYNWLAKQKQKQLEGNYLVEATKIKQVILEFFAPIEKQLDNWAESNEQKQNASLCKYLVDSILSELVEFPDALKSGWVDSRAFITGILGEKGATLKCGDMRNQKLQSKLLSVDEYSILMGEIETLLIKLKKDDFKAFAALLAQAQKIVLNQVSLAKLSPALSAIIDSKPNFDYCLKQALGCPAECDFCGARCQEQFECKEKDRQKHKSDCHRPMAFKGTHQVQKGKKHLLRDFCVSRDNFKSRWPKQTQLLQDSQILHKRLGDEGLKVDTLNVYLCWRTGSDLDINVRCGCGDWHGFGTPDSSCICSTCDMYRDRDVTRGQDGRSEESTVEHVYFKNERKMIGKNIGMRVYNFNQDSSQPRNDFKLCIFNKYGRILFPNPGGATVVHDSSWMFCSSTSKSVSAERNYCLQERDIEEGRDSLADSFLQYAARVSPQWQYSEADMTEKANDLNFKNFIANCGDKWQIVRKEMCEGFEMLESCAPHLD